MILLRCSLLCLLAASAACGCSRSAAPSGVALSGKVRFAERPIPPGTLIFVSDRKIVGKAKYGPDGHFYAVGLPAGDLGVAVSFKPPMESIAAQKSARGPVRMAPGHRWLPATIVASQPAKSSGKNIDRKANDTQHELATAIEAIHGNIVQPTHRIVLAPEPIEQTIDVNFVGP